MKTAIFDGKRAGLCRGDFPALSRKLNGEFLAYFDGPGGTQVPQRVIDAVGDYYARCNSNIHGMFVTTQETDEMLMKARTVLADFLGAPSWSCISFGANMTTLGFSLAHAVARGLAPGDEILITQLDHEANRGPWLNLRQYGVVVQEVALLPSGELDYEDMRRKVTPRTKALAIGMSSNALGTANDVATARRLTREAGALLILDAVHYAPHYPIDVQVLDTDFLLCSAYKFYGPHIGVLYSRPGALEALATDALATQEPEAPYRIETGTLNHEGIAGALAAVEYIESLGAGDSRRGRLVSAMNAIADYEHALAERYYDGVRRIPGVKVWGPDFSKHRTPTVSITLDGIAPIDAAKKLGDLGLCTWDGDFYAAKAIEVLGLKERGGVLRVGISLYNTEAEVDRLLAVIANLLKN